jgi:hypothetical protein
LWPPSQSRFWLTRLFLKPRSLITPLGEAQGSMRYRLHLRFCYLNVIRLTSRSAIYSLPRRNLGEPIIKGSQLFGQSESPNSGAGSSNLSDLTRTKICRTAFNGGLGGNRTRVRNTFRLLS